jgi:adenosylcobyric acid synthase
MGDTTCEHSTEQSQNAPIISAGQVLGTYVHGLFDDDELRHKFIDHARQKCALAPMDERIFATAQRQARIDRWANHLRQALDMTLIRKCANI